MSDNQHIRSGDVKGQNLQASALRSAFAAATTEGFGLKIRGSALGLWVNAQADAHRGL